jgi:hypothetical protein
VTDPLLNRLEPDAVRVNLRVASVGSLLITVLAFGALTAGGVYAAADAEDTSTRVLGIVFAVLFSIPLWMVVMLLAKGILQSNGIAFDSRGVHYWRGDSAGLVAWEDITAVGIGYEQPPHLPKVPTSIDGAIKDFLADKIKDTVRLKDLRKIALEIYPETEEVASQHPDLTRYWRTYPAQFEGLLPVRWRLPLPPLTGVARAISRALQTYQPQRSIGWFKRPWSGGLFGAGKGL